MFSEDWLRACERFAPAHREPPSASQATVSPVAGGIEPLLRMFGTARGTDAQNPATLLADCGRSVSALIQSAFGQATRPLFGALSSGPDVYHATLDEPNQRTREVSTSEMLQIVSSASALIVDARTRLEFSIGHIPTARNVAPKPQTPMSQFVSDVAEISRLTPHRAAPIVVYCNGPFCGKSKRLGAELVQAGFTSVARYQLGTPTWRALVGPMQIELDGIRYIGRNDRTAVFIDARTPAEFATGSLAGARNVPPDEIVRAKDDGRLPMDDFNTRVVTVGGSGIEALLVAMMLAHHGFNNVKFYAGTVANLLGLSL